MSIALLLVALSLSASDAAPIPLAPSGEYFHFQSFSDDSWTGTWGPSGLPNVTGQWELAETAPPQGYPGEKMIFMKSKSAHYGLATTFSEPLVLTDKTLIVQYEVRAQDILECGGSYLKLFGDDNFRQAELSNETRYIIMFGPDRCGSTNKVHFIFRHKDPKTGVYEEKHLNNPPSPPRDKFNHLYTLVVRPDNTFDVMIDGLSHKRGSLLEDFTPSVNPPKEVDDPDDKKPADWVDQEMIVDPEAKKPDDWDETAPEYIPDPERAEAPAGWLPDEPKLITEPDAVKPDDWDESQGEWKPRLVPNPKCKDAAGCGEYRVPKIKNPNYKGKWRPPRIQNPAYKGRWAPRKIPNPAYYEDPSPANFEPLIGAGFEVWMVNSDVGFANVFIGNDEDSVNEWNEAHFIPKSKKQKEPTPTPIPTATPAPTRKTETETEEGKAEEGSTGAKSEEGNTEAKSEEVESGPGAGEL
jgi:calnexin